MPIVYVSGMGRFVECFFGNISVLQEAYRKLWRTICHQTFQVPKMEVLTYINSMDTAYVRDNPPPQNGRKSGSFGNPPFLVAIRQAG